MKFTTFQKALWVAALSAAPAVVWAQPSFESRPMPTPHAHNVDNRDGDNQLKHDRDGVQRDGDGDSGGDDVERNERSGGLRPHGRGLEMGRHGKGHRPDFERGPRHDRGRGERGRGRDGHRMDGRGGPPRGERFEGREDGAGRGRPDWKDDDRPQRRERDFSNGPRHEGRRGEFGRPGNREDRELRGPGRGRRGPGASRNVFRSSTNAAAGRDFGLTAPERIAGKPLAVSGAVTVIAADNSVGLRTDDGHSYWVRLPQNSGRRLQVGERIEVNGQLEDNFLIATTITRR